MNTIRGLIALAKLYVSLQLYMMFVTGSSRALRRVQKYTAMLTDEEGVRVADLVRRRLMAAADIKANTIHE